MMISDACDLVSFTIKYISGVLVTTGRHFTHSKETSVPF